MFISVPALDARNVSTLQNIYDAEDLDFRLRPGSAAVDKGTVLPSVTDGFTGSAPDLGALEVGGAAPHYGPRGQRRSFSRALSSPPSTSV